MRMIESTFWADIVSIFESGHFTDESVLVAEKPESLDTKADNAEDEVTKQESQAEIVDTNKAQEEEYLRRYGRLPKKVVPGRNRKERKYFDSADFQMGGGVAGPHVVTPGSGSNSHSGGN